MRAENASWDARMAARHAIRMRELADEMVARDPNGPEGPTTWAARMRADQAEWEARQAAQHADWLWKIVGDHRGPTEPTPSPAGAHEPKPAAPEPESPTASPKPDAAEAETGDNSAPESDAGGRTPETGERSREAEPKPEAEAPRSVSVERPDTAPLDPSARNGEDAGTPKQDGVTGISEPGQESVPGDPATDPANGVEKPLRQPRSGAEAPKPETGYEAENAEPGAEKREQSPGTGQTKQPAGPAPESQQTPGSAEPREGASRVEGAQPDPIDAALARQDAAHAELRRIARELGLPDRGTARDLEAAIQRRIEDESAEHQATIARNDLRPDQWAAARDRAQQRLNELYGLRREMMRAARDYQAARIEGRQLRAANPHSAPAPGERASADGR
ncbi:hypothetical protein FHY52_38130, partial [Nocardia nova]|nr:hypothetical protein [Nocardia nova]